MSGVIYLMRDNSGLVVMREQAYDTEDLLQGYLADHPDLLAGGQINDAEPRRWLLISREMGLPSEEGGGDRWSTDHLFERSRVQQAGADLAPGDNTGTGC